MSDRPDTPDVSQNTREPVQPGASGPSDAPGGSGHGAHGRPPTGADRWAAFKRSPFLPACVLVLILAAAAALFAGSYTYTMANPTPRHIPTAVVGSAGTEEGRAFITGMEKALHASLELRPFATDAQARDAVEVQRIFAIITVRQGSVELDVASAAGASVAQVLAESAARVSGATGVPVEVRDIKRLQPGDPRGLALFYISLAAVIIGFVGAIQLSVHARALQPAERIGFTVAYALLGGFAIAATVDWLLNALDLPFVESWLILALTMFASGMVFTMFNTLIGRWAMLPTWGLMVLLGNPSSGGAVSWPLLPSALGHIGRWLPPGASVNAQHTAVYFGGHQHVFPFAVLAGWALVSSGVFWFWRHRHPGGRSRTPAHAAD
ncbi:ABC transporter permease [Streptomyces sp. SP18CS02]|uniref:ABC transporter permease n=1 Tax=Streptomyces sp. SP18CS02 TaxID=3002531 RepID=UPI002E762C06|nr:ABC transporter permease [Streptomyces sp. SP18CS02]MEE1757427.1 ABC transporter permease [Streptomyces sp. SP18CS02]